MSAEASVGGAPTLTLAARGLRVTRGGKAILRGVDLDAHAGEVVGVLGPSGAGKSTLFRAIAGETPPDEGTVTLFGHDMTHWPLWRRARESLRHVPQRESRFLDLTVRPKL